MNPSIPPKTIYSWIQKMNNSATLCLQIGQYERAIKSLAKALQLSRSHIEGTRANDESSNDSTGDGFSRCRLLSLDGCIHYSEDYVRNCSIHRKLRTSDSRGNISDNVNEETIRKRFLERRQGRRNRTGIENATPAAPFLYRQLIQVPDLSFNECNEDVHSRQIMVLSLISIFNLAVVCHLRAMNEISKSTTGLLNRQATTDLTKALKLYEVALKALEKQNGVMEDSSRSSVQFKLIVCNNLSHVYNVIGNQSENERYLREVLSLAMSLLDSHRPWNNNSEDNSSSNNGLFQQCQPKCIDLEGFLANAAPLLAERFCADAA